MILASNLLIIMIFLPILNSVICALRDTMRDCLTEAAYV